MTLKEVQVPVALSPRGDTGHLTRSQSVWRWRVRGRDVLSSVNLQDSTAGPQTPHRPPLTSLSTNQRSTQQRSRAAAPPSGRTLSSC